VYFISWHAIGVKKASFLANWHKFSLFFHLAEFIGVILFSFLLEQWKKIDEIQLSNNTF